MNQFITEAVVLRRTDYGEADRIITFITPDYGKITAIAKGARKSKSKLAGAIEPFSVSEIKILIGKSEVSTLMSSRLISHFSGIVKNLDRTNTAYEFMRSIDQTTEEQTEEAYYNLLKNCLSALNKESIDLPLVKAYFMAQQLRLAGHSPNLTTDPQGDRLQEAKKYNFDVESMGFIPGKKYDAGQIKFLRLLFSDNDLSVISRIEDYERLAASVEPLVRAMQTSR